MQSEHKPVIEASKIRDFVEKEFTENALPALMDFVRIPNLSRCFDKDFLTNGLLNKAAEFVLDWIKKQNIKGLKSEIIQEKDRTPLIFLEIEGSNPGAQTVLYYGHIDKQPHLFGWMEGTGPTTPVIIDDKLYGRGASDDGYAGFATILSVKACQHFGVPHPRIVVVLEADEESGSVDLPFYVNFLEARIGQPSIIVCLDSGCGNYETLWLTQSLRGLLLCNVTVKVLSEGVHSGDASGVVPSSFRIMRQLINRIENVETGEIHSSFQVSPPPNRYEEAFKSAEVLGSDLVNKFPRWKNTKNTTENILNLYLNRTWKAQLSITGADGLPPTSIAGNVLLPYTTLRFSLRLPPTLCPEVAAEAFKKILSENSPYDCEVCLGDVRVSPGWNAPVTKPYLNEILNSASKKDCLAVHEGGSIPFMNMLEKKFPKAQFIVAGVLGPASNAHGPNEMLHIPYTKNLICCMTQMLADVYEHLKN